jgi:hypothetical protein
VISILERDLTAIYSAATAFSARVAGEAKYVAFLIDG